MSQARKHIELGAHFGMRHGGVLDNAVMAYETWGRINDSGDNAVLIFTGLSPSAHAAASADDSSPGWWEEMVGKGHPIDTDRYYVICVNSLGSCFGSTGPASINPATGKPYRLSFPILTVEDIAAAARVVTGELGVSSLYATVGPSMGGMTAVAFDVMFPGYSRALVSISGAARALPFAIALRSLQREIIRKDSAWNDGDYEEAHGPTQGMRLARKLGMITYRSAEEWRHRFGRERVPEERKRGDQFCIDFEVEAYLESHANKFIGQFDANCYLYLSRAMDLFDIAEHGGSVQAALSQTSVERSLIIGVETDILFPLHQQKEIADGLKDAGGAVEFVSLPSIQGHDSFLVDMDRFRPIVAKFFE